MADDHVRQTVLVDIAGNNCDRRIELANHIFLPCSGKVSMRSYRGWRAPTLSRVCGNAFIPSTGDGIVQELDNPETRPDLRSCKGVFRHGCQIFLRDNSWHRITLQKWNVSTQYPSDRLPSMTERPKDGTGSFAVMSLTLFGWMGTDFPGAESPCRRVIADRHLRASIYKRNNIPNVANRYLITSR